MNTYMDIKKKQELGNEKCNLIKRRHTKRNKEGEEEVGMKEQKGNKERWEKILNPLLFVCINECR